MIYLDNAATTFPKSESVYKALDDANRSSAFNAGRGSYKVARESVNTIEEAKRIIKELGKAPDIAEVVFAPSITIALNIILQGIQFAHGDTIYVSPYEHNAVARVVHLLKKRIGIKVKEIPIDEETLEIDLALMEYEFIQDKPICVCCTHVSNVTGYILPVKEIFDLAKKQKAITILDSAQSLGVVEIEDTSNIDFLAFTGHKTLYGPLGIGGFILYNNYRLQSIFAGGTGSNSLNLEMPNTTPEQYEFASTNIVAIKGLVVALRECQINENYEQEKKLLEYLVKKLQPIEEIHMYLPPKDRHIGMVSFIVNGYKSEEVAMILDEDFDIAVRAGYHCAPYIHKWMKDEESLGTIRVGIGKFNTVEDIEFLVNSIKEIIE